jgi:hypothetical protein
MVQSVMCTRSLFGFPLQHRGYKLDNRKFSAVASFKPPVERLVLLPAYLFSRPGMSKQFCYYKCKSPDVYTFFVILSFYLFWRKIWYRSWRIIWDSFLLDGASEITNGHVDRVKAFHEQVGWFDVSMYDPILVEKCDSIKSLFEQDNTIVNFCLRVDDCGKSHGSKASDKMHFCLCLI